MRILTCLESVQQQAQARAFAGQQLQTGQQNQQGQQPSSGQTGQQQQQQTAGLTMQQLQALYLTRSIPGLGFGGMLSNAAVLAQAQAQIAGQHAGEQSGGNTGANGSDISHGYIDHTGEQASLEAQQAQEANAFNTAAEAAHVNLMLRNRLEVVNKTLKEVQETYNNCEKLPESGEKARKLENALKEIISLTEEKVRLMELITATGSPAAASLAGLGYNLSLLDLAQLQQLFMHAYAQGGQTQQQLQQQHLQQQLQQQKDDAALTSAIEQAVAGSSSAVMDHSHVLHKGSDSLADYVTEHQSDLQFPMIHEDSGDDSDDV